MNTSKPTVAPRLRFDVPVTEMITPQTDKPPMLMLLHHASTTLGNSTLISPEQVEDEVSQLWNIRHDMLHVLLCHVLSVPANLGAQQPISSIFNLPHEFPYKYTPDIVYYYQKKDEYWIIDPSIGSNFMAASDNKTKKYAPLIEGLCSQGYKAKFYPVCVNARLEGIAKCLPKNFPWPPADHIWETYYKLHTEVQEKLERLYPFMPQKPRSEMPERFKTEILHPDEYMRLVGSTPQGRDLFEDLGQTEDDFFELFYQLVEDPEIVDLLSDTPTKLSSYEKSFLANLEEANNSSSKLVKPSFHIPFAPYMELGLPKVPDCDEDQSNIINFHSFVRSMKHHPAIALLNEIMVNLEDALGHTADKSMFYTGTYTGDKELDARLLDAKPEHSSTRQYFREKGYNLKESKPYVEKNRIITLGKSSTAFDFTIKSGVRYFDNHTHRKYKKPTSCPPSEAKVFSEFLELLYSKPSIPHKYPQILLGDAGCDNDLNLELKRSSRAQFHKYLKYLSNHEAANFAYQTHLVARSILHFTSFKTKEDQYQIVNTGYPNIIHIIRGSQVARGTDTGLPFYSLILTRDLSWATNVFGNHEVLDMGNDVKLIVYPWRRIPLKRLSFIADAYYNCMSSGFDTYIRQSFVDDTMDNFMHIYLLRLLCNISITQRVGELLLDVRYVAMSLISVFSGAGSLIKEKFAPPYPTSFTRWIVHTLSERVSLVYESYNEKGNIERLRPIFVEGQRISASKGGLLHVTSLWSNKTLHELQDWFDDLFVYCHTPKEPSNEHHEQIKAINTILEYQEEYNNLPNHVRTGRMNFQQVKEWLLSKSKVGCLASACYYSAEHIARSKLDTGLMQRIKRLLETEPLSEINSTKAAVPEYPVTIKTVEHNEKISKKHMLKKQSLMVHLGVTAEDERVPVIHRIASTLPTSAVLADTKTGRCKVHDCIQDHLLRRPSDRTVLAVAHWNMFCNTNKKAVAHTCIKAQYGAKREFYVVNFGAKCMLRCYENTFKLVSQCLDEEMISNPGDSKLIYMAKLADEALQWEHSAKYEQFFVNGDCSKWSAAETMTSFLWFLEGLKNKIGEQATRYCQAVVSLWADKDIKVPASILESTHFITEKTQYLRQGSFIHSTQNFLQGMFNYSSSVKAVAGTTLAIHLWQRRNPDKRIFVKHLEHSDDYLLVCRAESLQTVKDFRVYHKLMQRLIGVNDSSKKTNIQQHVLEFISLMSFNGHMSYPTIKKTKEAGLNISCEGYQRDMMTPVSRSAESLRMGVPIMTCYIQQLIQAANILQAYGLGVKGTNYKRLNYNLDHVNMPIELGGIPDCLPIAYLNCTMNPNNLRLYRYSRDPTLILKLLEFSSKLSQQTSTEGMLEPLVSLQYSYPRASSSLNAIKNKVPMSRDEAKSFFDECPEYLIMKPRDPLLYMKWLCSMYHLNSFAKAYHSVSRANLLLRISYFVHRKCVWPLEEDGDKMTLSGSLNYLMDSVSKQTGKTILKVENLLTMLNPTPIYYYNLTDGAALVSVTQNPNKPVATKLPKPIQYLGLRSPIQAIIQHSISPERFTRDERWEGDPNTLDADRQKIEALMEKPINALSPTELCSLVAMVSPQSQRMRYGLGYTEGGQANISLYLRTWLEDGVHPLHRYRLIAQKSVLLKHPLDDRIILEKSFSRTQGLHETMLDQMSQLFYYMCVVNDESLEVYKDKLESATVPLYNVPVMRLLFEMNPTLDYNIYTRRQISFFKAALLSDWSHINELTKSRISFGHARLVTSPIKGLHIDFRINYMQRVFYGYKKFEQLYILTNSFSVTTNAAVYNIYRYLKHELTMSALEYSLQNKAIDMVPANCEVDKFGDYRIAKVGTQYYIHDGEIKSYPFTIYVKPLHGQVDTHEQVMLEPRIYYKEALVFIGDSRMFKLPLLSTTAETCIDWGNTTYRDVAINDLFEDHLLHDYLKSEPNPHAAQTFDISKFSKLGVLADNIKKGQVPVFNEMMSEIEALPSVKEDLEGMGGMCINLNRFDRRDDARLIKELSDMGVKILNTPRARLMNGYNETPINLKFARLNDHEFFYLPEHTCKPMLAAPDGVTILDLIENPPVGYTSIESLCAYTGAHLKSKNKTLKEYICLWGCYEPKELWREIQSTLPRDPVIQNVGLPWGARDIRSFIEFYRAGMPIGKQSASVYASYMSIVRPDLKPFIHSQVLTYMEVLSMSISNGRPICSGLLSKNPNVVKLEKLNENLKGQLLETLGKTSHLVFFECPLLRLNETTTLEDLMDLSELLIECSAVEDEKLFYHTSAHFISWPLQSIRELIQKETDTSYSREYLEFVYTGMVTSGYRPIPTKHNIEAIGGKKVLDFAKHSGLFNSLLSYGVLDEFMDDDEFLAGCDNNQSDIVTSGRLSFSTPLEDAPPIFDLNYSDYRPMEEGVSGELDKGSAEAIQHISQGSLALRQDEGRPICSLPEVCNLEVAIPGGDDQLGSESEQVEGMVYSPSASALPYDDPDDDSDDEAFLRRYMEATHQVEQPTTFSMDVGEFSLLSSSLRGNKVEHLSSPTPFGFSFNMDDFKPMAGTQDADISMLISDDDSEQEPIFSHHLEKSPPMFGADFSGIRVVSQDSDEEFEIESYPPQLQQPREEICSALSPPTKFSFNSFDFVLQPEITDEENIPEHSKNEVPDHQEAGITLGHGTQATTQSRGPLQEHPIFNFNYGDFQLMLPEDDDEVPPPITRQQSRDLIHSHGYSATTMESVPSDPDMIDVSATARGQKNITPIIEFITIRDEEVHEGTFSLDFDLKLECSQTVSFKDMLSRCFLDAKGLLNKGDYNVELITSGNTTKHKSSLRQDWFAEFVDMDLSRNEQPNTSSFRCSWLGYIDYLRYRKFHSASVEKGNEVYASIMLVAATKSLYPNADIICCSTVMSPLSRRATNLGLQVLSEFESFILNECQSALLPTIVPTVWPVTNTNVSAITVYSNDTEVVRKGKLYYEQVIKGLGVQTTIVNDNVLDQFLDRYPKFCGFGSIEVVNKPSLLTDILSRNVLGLDLWQFGSPSLRSIDNMLTLSDLTLYSMCQTVSVAPLDWERRCSAIAILVARRIEKTHNITVVFNQAARRNCPLRYYLFNGWRQAEVSRYSDMLVSETLTVEAQLVVRGVVAVSNDMLLEIELGEYYSEEAKGYIINLIGENNIKRARESCTKPGDVMLVNITKNEWSSKELSEDINIEQMRVGYTIAAGILNDIAGLVDVNDAEEIQLEKRGDSPKSESSEEETEEFEEVGAFTNINYSDFLCIEPTKLSYYKKLPSLQEYIVRWAAYLPIDLFAYNAERMFELCLFVLQARGFAEGLKKDDMKKIILNQITYCCEELLRQNWKGKMILNKLNTLALTSKDGSLFDIKLYKAYLFQDKHFAIQCKRSLTIQAPSKVVQYSSNKTGKVFVVLHDTEVECVTASNLQYLIWPSIPSYHLIKDVTTMIDLKISKLSVNDSEVDEFVEEIE